MLENCKTIVFLKQKNPCLHFNLISIKYLVVPAGRVTIAVFPIQDRLATLDTHHGSCTPEVYGSEQLLYFPKLYLSVALPGLVDHRFC